MKRESLLRHLRHVFGRRHAATEAHHLREAGHRAALAAAYGLHHVGHAAMHLQELVDLFDLGAGA